jgi:hypothetical protein
LFKRVQRAAVQEEAREVKYQRKEVSFGGVVPLINLVAPEAMTAQPSKSQQTAGHSTEGTYFETKMGI